MVNEDYSCIKEVTKVVNLTLPSLYNTNEISGICDALESWKRQYVKQLQGIVVGYKNVSLTSKRGYLKADCPVIYCNVKATFELFYPTIGSIIKGKINRISQDYIGCLVHDTINVTVHRTADISCDISKFIVLDHFILFQITRIVFKSKFIHVKGKITEGCVKLMKESGLLSDNIDVPDSNNILTCSSPDFPCSSNSSIVINNPTILNSNAQESSIDFDTPTDTSSQTSPHKKKKKHKKSKENFSMSPLSPISGLLENNLNQVDSAQSSDNNSRKRKRKKSDINLSSTNVLENEIESAHPKKKTKTKEHITSDMNEVEFSEFPNNTRKRKRKKSDVNLAFLEALDETEPIHPNKKIKTEELITSVEDSAEFFENNLLFMSSDISNFENSAVKHELSSPVKKKKHKKSKSNSDAPSSFSDHTLTTEVNKIEPALFLSTSPNKTSPSSQIKSEDDVLASARLLDGTLIETNTDSKLLNSKKKKKKKESALDKNKTLKKKKDKLKKGSKKDKKKKPKVISSKKKLLGYTAKLKKKKKNKDKKSKNPKKIKNKKSQDVPE